MIIVGLISYSAYLWHQPILALSRYYFVGELSSIKLLLLISLTLFLAYISWRFIEKPFRDKKIVSRKGVFIFSAIGSLLFGAIGLTIHLNNGFIERFDANQIKLLNFHKYDQRDELYRKRICFLRNNQNGDEFKDICKSGPILIWGDSHAASLSYGMGELTNISQLTATGCPPVINYASEISEKNYCQSINQHVTKFIAERQPRAVFISANWIMYRNNLFDTSLAHMLESISKNNPSIKFFVLGGLPQWQPSLPSNMLRGNILLDGKETYIENQLYEKVKSKDNTIEEIVSQVQKENLKFISLLEMLCEYGKCLSQTNYPQIEPIAFDYGHLTGSGSIKVASLLFDSLNLEHKIYE